MFATMRTVADRIRFVLSLVRCREVAELSPQELGRIAGLGRGVVDQILAGNSEDPRGSTLFAIAGALGVTSDYLAGGVGATPRAAQVRAAVERARGRVSAGAGGHAAKVSAATGARKVAARSRVARAVDRG